MTITDYFSQLCQHCGVTVADVTTNEDDEHIEATIQVDPEDAGLLIGNHGETILSLQRLARVTFASPDFTKRLLVNINDYRQQQEEKLRGLLITTAQRALDTQSSVAFPAQLNSAERYFIHTTLASLPEFSSLESLSVGEDRNRRLLIQPKRVDHLDQLEQVNQNE